MTNRKFQSTEKGYDRSQESREAQSAVDEAEMLFGDEPADGMADLMAKNPAETDGRWELPKSVGTESNTAEPVNSDSSETQMASSQVESEVTAQPEAPQAAMQQPTEEPADEKITTVVRRSSRSSRASRNQRPKKPGFFSRLFGRS
ncbi:MAG: hypothetical protein AAF196_03490 [Planctomycetota bacterium]